MTNGSGMVQFSRGFMRFGKALPIVPVALRVTVPWNIQTHTLTSNFVANLFWFSFVPWVRLDATVLKPMSLSEVSLRDAVIDLHVGTPVHNHQCVTSIALWNLRHAQCRSATYESSLQQCICSVYVPGCCWLQLLMSPHCSIAFAVFTFQAVAGFSY